MDGSPGPPTPADCRGVDSCSDASGGAGTPTRAAKLDAAIADPLSDVITWLNTTEYDLRDPVCGSARRPSAKHLDVATACAPAKRDSDEDDVDQESDVGEEFALRGGPSSGRHKMRQLAPRLDRNSVGLADKAGSEPSSSSSSRGAALLMWRQCAPSVTPGLSLDMDFSFGGGFLGRRGHATQAELQKFPTEAASSSASGRRFAMPPSPRGSDVAADIGAVDPAFIAADTDGDGVGAPDGESGACGSGVCQPGDFVERDFAFEEEEEWETRQRTSGTVGRLVMYQKGDHPKDDIVLRGGGGGRHIVVAGVRENGQASRTGVRAGDRLVSIDGRKEFLGLPADMVRERLEAPTVLVFLGFVGKLQAEVRLTTPSAICGISTRQEVLKGTFRRPLQLEEERVLNAGFASMFLTVDQRTDDFQRMQKAKAVVPDRQPSLFELRRPEAVGLVKRALKRVEVNEGPAACGHCVGYASAIDESAPIRGEGGEGPVHGGSTLLQPVKTSFTRSTSPSPAATFASLVAAAAAEAAAESSAEAGAGAGLGGSPRAGRSPEASPEVSPQGTPLSSVRAPRSADGTPEASVKFVTDIGAIISTTMVASA